MTNSLPIGLDGMIDVDGDEDPEGHWEGEPEEPDDAVDPLPGPTADPALPNGNGADPRARPGFLKVTTVESTFVKLRTDSPNEIFDSPSLHVGTAQAIADAGNQVRYW